MYRLRQAQDGGRWIFQWKDSVKVCTKVPQRKVSRRSVLLFRKDFRLLCFATWSGRRHCDPSSILCYLCVGRVNNMEKLLMSSEELKGWVLYSSNCFAFFFSFLNMFSRKLAFRSGQECTTTLENLNCCFSPSLISGSLTVLVGSKKWKGSVRTNAVVFHDFN